MQNLKLLRRSVTILILVEGSLQLELTGKEIEAFRSHNPYFSRRFFAIELDKEEKI